MLSLPSPRQNRRNSGQAILEYLLLTVMIAVTIAIVIKNINLNIYRLWTGLARQVASPCADCTSPAPPDF